MRSEASRADNGIGYLSEYLVCSRVIVRFVLKRLMKREEVQGTELD